jgi:pimeloyl-ACP methyl ester carboxylesterase
MGPGREARVRVERLRIEMDDGVGLAVEVAGSGPALVLVHGFGGAKEDFAEHVAPLAEHATVVVFDHRGHGESDHPPDERAYSLDRLVADTVDVVAASGLGRVALLGHSMGGMVARRLVLAHPERVEALVLMDTSPGPPPGIDAAAVGLGVEVARTEGMAALKAALDVFDPLGTPAYRRLLAARPGYQAFCDRKWAALSREMWAALATELVRQPDQLDALAHVSCPTLVLVGDQDIPFLDVSKAMAATIRDATLVVVPDAGHSPQFENPAVWFDAVEGFTRAHQRDAA